MSGSDEKVWWKCDKGHEWEAKVVKRFKGNKFLKCANVKRSESLKASKKYKIRDDLKVISFS
ncbi:zinc-ribbon domain-containing protein [[Brevibacterium] frigoritolerans]|nr:zinc-ribbon domain-containing protein [Peribacillus frigoritolerans]